MWSISGVNPPWVKVRVQIIYCPGLFHCNVLSVFVYIFGCQTMVENKLHVLNKYAKVFVKHARIQYIIKNI